MISKIKDYIKKHKFKAIAYMRGNTYYYKKQLFKNKYTLIIKTCPYGMSFMTYNLGEYDTIDEIKEYLKSINARIIL